MKNNNLNLISQFLNSDFDYENTIIEFEDGEKINLSDSLETSVSQSPQSLVLTSCLKGYKAELCFNKTGDNICSVSLSLDPVAGDSKRIRKVSSMKLVSGFNDNTRMLIHGGGLGKEGIRPVKDIENNQKCNHFYSCFNAENPQNAFTAATYLPAKFRSEIIIEKTDKDFSLSFDTIIPFSFEGKIICQEWIIYLNMPLTEALEKNAQSFSSSKPFEAPVGWSTWDYYFTSATEDDVKQNVDFIAADKTLSEKVRYIALDDGWQQREGDWQSGIRYPSGLKSLVDYINEKGFEAGIWIAPTRLHNLCGTVMRRHSFLVRDEYGDPVSDEDMYILDPTHPDGEAFLRECFKYLAACGFTFYKLDFISNLLKYADRFYDKNAGPYDALRKLFEITRSCVPEGSHIMGCSCPYSIGADWVDSRRTGWDIHNTWDHVQICLHSYLPQYASNAKIYRNDIDYLVVRGADTSNDPMTNVLHASKGKYLANPTDKPRWRGGPDFSFTEAKTWCTSVLLTGSSIFMGDNLPMLNQNGTELLKTTLENADFTAATPVICGDEIVPEIWYKKELKKLYVINFSKAEKTYCVSVGDYFSDQDLLYRDVFTNTVYKTVNGKLEFTLKSHDSLCLVPNTLLYTGDK